LLLEIIKLLLVMKKIVKENSYIYKSKMIKIPVEKMSFDTKMIFKKSGIGADYTKVEEKKKRNNFF